MIFSKTDLADAQLIRLDPREDERGFFARTWCRDEMASAGIEPIIAQQSMSHTKQRGTIRGMHLQRAPDEETKIVRCIKGALYDVIIDLRPDSPTYLRWQGFELTEENRSALFVPKGFAHGFQTLADNSQALYEISVAYVPDASMGYMYNDPAFRITWPIPVTVVGEKDRHWAPYRR